MQGQHSDTAVARGFLQAIFAVFLGLMITAVVGVGVYTFHPNPVDDIQDQIEALSQQRTELDGCSKVTGVCPSWEDLTEDQRTRIAALDAKITALQQQEADSREAWSQSTSIILIATATILMVISLLLGETLAVLSNGILLGGLFTMLYGVGWGIASGNSLTRFLVLLVALLVSLALGYLTFVRKQGRARRVSPEAAAEGDTPGAAADGAAPGAGAVSPADEGMLADVTARVSELERRLAGVAHLLGSDPSSRD